MRDTHERLSDVAAARKALHLAVEAKAHLVREIARIQVGADVEIVPLRARIREQEAINLKIRGEIEAVMQEGLDVRKRDAEAEEKQRVLEYEYRKWRVAGLSDDAALRKAVEVADGPVS